MDLETFEKADDLRTAIFQLENILEKFQPAKSYCNPKFQVTFSEMGVRDDTIDIPSEYTDEICQILENHLDKLNQEFKKL